MTINTGQRVAVVTGSSSGIGFETSLALARNGFHTFATMRNLEKSSQITEQSRNENLPIQATQLDVNNEKSVIEGINRTSEKNERIDVVVNNAGYDLIGPLEETSMAEIMAQLNPTFWCYKSNTGGNTYNERTEKRENSKYSICWRENCNSLSLWLPWDKVCVRRTI
jgi:NAD(P)-dependent dehydrogenase (short-subunit alcohol dehydrogenase family)